MDPKETLTILRLIVIYANSTIHLESLNRKELEKFIEEFAEHFDALDIWLKSGGFSPWEKDK